MPLNIDQDEKPHEKASMDDQSELHDYEEVCPYCGGKLVTRHCKVVCNDCGEILRDCSDPF